MSCSHGTSTILEVPWEHEQFWPRDVLKAERWVQYGDRDLLRA